MVDGIEVLFTFLCGGKVELRKREGKADHG
jgi:hypothetical protein